MAVDTIQEKVDSALNRESGASGDLYRRENQAAAGDNLESAFMAPSVTEQERRRNQPRDTRQQPSRYRRFVQKTKLRGKTSLIAVLLTLLGAGGAISVFVSPSFAIVQLSHIFTQDLNDQLKAFEDRSGVLMRTKLKDVTNSSCGAVKACKRFGTVNDAQVKKFAQHGIHITYDKSKSIIPGRGQATRFEVIDPDTGKSHYATTPNELYGLMNDKASIRSQFIRAHNPTFMSMSDKVAKLSLRLLGASKASKITGDTDEAREKSLNSAIGEGEKIDPRTLKAEVDENDKPTGRMLGPNGEVLTQQQVDLINESGAMMDQATKVKPSKIITSIGKVVMITTVADSACMVSNAIQHLDALTVSEKSQQAAVFATSALHTPANKIMANDGEEGEGTFVGNKINNIGVAAPDEKIIDESRIDEAGTANNPPMINNPNLYATAFDSPGAMVAQGFKSAPMLDSRAARFTLTGWLIGSLAKVNTAIALVLTGGTNPDPQVIRDKCKFIQNPYVRGAALAAGIFVGIGSFGLAQAAGITGSLAFSMALPYIMSLTASVLAGDIFQNLYGMDFGDGAFVGTAAIMGVMAQHRGLEPLSAEEAVAYTQSAKQNQEKYAEVQRYLAKSEPFNIYNQYSFFGSLASSVAPVARQNNKSAATMAISLTQLIPTSFASLTGSTAKAANASIDRFQQCKDPSYTHLDIGADIFCNVRYGMSDEELGMDPLENAMWMASTGNIDPDSETGEAKDNGQKWNYTKYLEQCVNRTVPVGKVSAMEGGNDGRECISGENEVMNKHFRVYTIDKTVNDALDGDMGDSNMPGTSGYGTGEKGAVSAEGWAYPTVKEGFISPGGKYKDASRGDDHQGVDIITHDETMGKPIFAVRDGVVVAAGPAQGFGNWIIISHNVDGKRVDSVYGHMYDDGVFVKVGDTVRAGQQIGKIGSKGNSTGPHLHFELWAAGRFDGSSIDPTAIIERAKSGPSSPPPPSGDVRA